MERRQQILGLHICISTLEAQRTESLKEMLRCGGRSPAACKRARENAEDIQLKLEELRKLVYNLENFEN